MNSNLSKIEKQIENRLQNTMLTEAKRMQNFFMYGETQEKTDQLKLENLIFQIEHYDPIKTKLEHVK